MASTQTVVSFLKKASLQLSDNNPQFTRWTQAELIGWINDGQIAVAKFMPWSCARDDAIKLVMGTRQSIDVLPAATTKPLDGSAAPTLMRGNLVLSVDYLMGADGVSPGRALRIVDRETLDSSNPMWRSPKTYAKEPSEYSYDPRLPKVFNIVPGLKADTELWVAVSMLIDPAALDTTLDYSVDPNKGKTLSVDDLYGDELLNYVLSRAYMKDAEAQGSVNLVAVHSKLFVDSINAQVKARTGVNPNLKSLPLNAAVPAEAS